MVAESLLILVLVVSLAALVFAIMAWRAAGRPAAASPELLERLALVQAAASEHPRLLRDETARLTETQAREAGALRDTVGGQLLGFQSHLAERFDRLGEQQAKAAADLRAELTEGQTKAGEAVDAATRRFGDAQRERLEAMQGAQKQALDKVEAELKRLVQVNAEEQAKARQTLADQLEQVRKDGEQRQEKVRETLTQSLEQLRKENEAKLEQMRQTVDEKLQGTLEQRLGEKFKTVSDSIEAVTRQAGEMQAVAASVGDLKRALSNVKSRGSWGEVQLGALLEDMLTHEQFSRQVRVRKDGGEIVDYAVHLPEALLPLDCKFPHEDYERLMAAQDLGDIALVEAAQKGLERAIRIQAKSIADKYIHPPHTTPFAVMYLPTEGLFAEVVRRPGLTSELSNNYRVTVTGPTTLAALLNSLRMGFQTLAIQRNASDIMQRLGEAKKAFEDYGAAWEAVDKKLDEAKKKVAEVGVKHRTVNRKLRDVEAVETQPTLALADLSEPEAA